MASSPRAPGVREAAQDPSRFESLTGDTALPFPEYDDPPPEPLALAGRWLDEATARGVREPRSLALATADERGRASSRIVTVGELGPRGLLFTTHSTSRKARDLAAHPWASGVLYWRETAQQLVIAGPVRQLETAECEALWAARAVPLHAMTTASRQSEPVHDVAALRERARGLAAPGLPLPRPERFTGYVIEPAEVEFWLARPDRLHCRLHYVRESRAGRESCEGREAWEVREGHADHGWRVSRLQP
ncbi:phenazine biosynthesis FMN-dependent oxidase PhzG [Streptomyces monticola]|uniref:Phenazine biosynthesis FMN-dependent oxidase PhzG n=1 Tax=Streptomyces monticola TaxID=2666263 RepID=A0ABW2JD73_9ACTN